MKLWRHVLKLLYEYNRNGGGPISSPELARELDKEVKYRGIDCDLTRYHSFESLERSVRKVLDVWRQNGHVKRKHTDSRSFGRGKGSTPDYLYEISERGVEWLRYKGII